MLRITMNKSAAGAKKYYCEQYYQEGRNQEFDYYGEGQELIGRWGGLGAARLGLSGAIDKTAFARMCDNIAPYSGVRLTARNDSDRTVGYDFTFNASKSVSLAYAFAGDDDKRLILEAFQSAVRDTMCDVEIGMQARVRVKGKDENRLTENLAYGEFTHFTTRPIDGVPDPHLHSHCFVFNATYDEVEQKWKAGQFRQIKQDAPYYEAIFHAKLANYLQHAGYQVARTKSGFELVGLEKSTLDKFSRRTQEIEAFAEEYGISDEAKKSQIGAKTREAKRIACTPEQQAAAWNDRLTETERLALARLKSQVRPGEAAQVANKALSFSLAHHFERKSVASDKEILATAIRAAIGEALPYQVRDAFKHNTAILSVTEKLRTFLTTKDALQEERILIQRAHASRNKFRPINPDYITENNILNNQQRAAVRHALSSTDGITIITGKAGTGKTTLMREVQQGITDAGKRIFAFAPSSEASRGVQRSEGFSNADTVAHLIRQKDGHADFRHQVIWVDEAGMLSNKDMNHILAIAQAQSARVILSGDTRQHTSVERGDALRVLQQEAGIEPITVDKIQRQKTDAYREAVQLLSDGKTVKGFAALDRQGAIQEISDPQARLQMIAEDYYQSSVGQARDTLVIAPTHAEGDVVTQTIREKLKEEECIGQEERDYTILKNRQLTDAEKQQPGLYQIGDQVVFHQHAKAIKAGSRLDVQHSDEDRVVARDSYGLDHALPLSEPQKFTVFTPKTIGLTEGDKIRITANGQGADGKHLFNGSVFQVESFGDGGEVHLSNGSTLPADFGHFDHGYVSTSHAAQGKTADKVIVSQSAATFAASSMEQFYVSVSRGREAVSIYTDDKEHLLDVVTRSSERMSASELMAIQQEQQAEQLLQTQLRTAQQYSHIPQHTLINDRSHGL